MKYFIALSLLVVAVSAVPFKNNDKEVEQLKREKAAIVADRLDQFAPAASNNDAAQLMSLFATMKAAERKASADMSKLIPGIEKLAGAMKKLADPSDVPQWAEGLVGNMKNVVLKMIAAIIDGNRDNVAYYMYDAAQEWLVMRDVHASGSLKDQMNQAEKAIVAVRDQLDQTAQVFVQAVKIVRNSNDREQIRNAADHLDQTIRQSNLRELQRRADELTNQLP